eukprot:1534564-Pleurochrysis_carterae.AAC.5
MLECRFGKGSRGVESTCAVCFLTTNAAHVSKTQARESVEQAELIGSGRAVRIDLLEDFEALKRQRVFLSLLVLPILKRMESTWSIVDDPGKMALPASISPAFQSQEQHSSSGPSLPISRLASLLSTPQLSTSRLVCSPFDTRVQCTRQIVLRAIHACKVRDYCAANLIRQWREQEIGQEIEGGMSRVFEGAVKQHLLQRMRARRARDHTKDTPDCPHVNAERVLRRAHQDLRRAVPDAMRGTLRVRGKMSVSSP